MKNTEQKIPALRFPEFSDEWEEKRLGEVANKITDGTHDTPNKVNKGVPFITAIHINDGVIDYESCYYVEQDIHDKIYMRCNPERDDLLIVNIGAGTATCAINKVDYEFSLKNVALVKPNKELIDPYFLEQKQRRESKKIFHRSTSGGAQPFLGLKDISKIKHFFPSLPEQQKIADFMSVVDKRLQLLKDKKTRLEEYKRGVMQRIFSQELRFTRTDGSAYPDWEEKRLGELLIQHSERNKENKDIEVLSVSNKLGFIKQENQFENHRVASEDTSNYKIVKKGWFAYNPSRINVGSIAMLSDFLIGIVSPMYIVFELSSLLNSTYFGNLIKTHYYKYLIQIGCSGSVRESLNFSELEKMKIHLPHLDEQRQIADFLSAIDNKISLLSKQIQSTEQYKKGLLQQMFV